MLLALLALPVAYVAWMVALLLKRRPLGVGLSILVAAATVAAGAWSLVQSRSSTSGIGFIFLPMLGAVAGMLVLTYAESRRAESPVPRVLGLTALVAASVPAIVELRGGRATIARNVSRDADQARRDSLLVSYRARFDTIVATSGDRATDTVQALLRARRDDRELTLAALERPQVSAPLLDTFARSPDLGIALQAVRNPNASPETLVRIYRTHQYRDYFLQALAAHANTPPAILREIRALRPAPITGLDIWFAGNPSTPADVLVDVARTTESIDAVRTLLRHPALDCAMIEGVARGPAVRTHAADSEVTRLLTSERAARCR